MAQVDFAYEPANDAAGLPLTASLYADRVHLIEAMGRDAAAAGVRIGAAAPLAALVESGAQVLGDLVILDCPEAAAETLAALARLDVRASHACAQLIVSTTVAALDAVFGCLDQSDGQILVEPTRGERVIALGRALAKVPGMRVRELSEDDRLTLLRLTEQVGQIAERLERLSARQAGEPSAFRFESPAPAYRGEADEDERSLARKPKPPLPDPRLVRRIIRQRQLRARLLRPRAVRRSGVGHPARSHRRARRACAGLGDQPVHRQRGAADHRAQVDLAADRGRAARAGRGRGRSAPGFHRAVRQGGRGDGAILPRDAQGLYDGGVRTMAV